MGNRAWSLDCAFSPLSLESGCNKDRVNAMSFGIKTWHFFKQQDVSSMKFQCIC